MSTINKLLCGGILCIAGLMALFVALFINYPNSNAIAIVDILIVVLILAIVILEVVLFIKNNDNNI